MKWYGDNIWDWSHQTRPLEDGDLLPLIYTQNTQLINAQNDYDIVKCNQSCKSPLAREPDLPMRSQADMLIIDGVGPSASLTLKVVERVT